MITIVVIIKVIIAIKLVISIGIVKAITLVIMYDELPVRRTARSPGGTIAAII